MADADVSRTPTLAMHGSTSEPEPQEKTSTDGSAAAYDLEEKNGATLALPAGDDPESRYVGGKKLAIIFS
jgi:hypothetical protein